MPGLELPCPQCGAQVPFLSRASVFAVCAYCRSMILREGMDLRLLGEMAALQDDPSVLQLGSVGQWGGHSFALRGRLRLKWEDGFWDEWYAPAAQQDLWLAQAQGDYFVSAPATVPPKLDMQKLELDQEIGFSGHPFTVTDIKHARVIYAEGELPFSAPAGRDLLSIDLVGDDGAFATLTQGEGGVELYIGAQADFDSLKLRGLRKIDGW